MSGARHLLSTPLSEQNRRELVQQLIAAKLFARRSNYGVLMNRSSRW
jgi:hypothetical protein